MNPPPSPEAIERLRQMQRGAAAAADIRANGGAPSAIDAVLAPQSCEIAGITLFCYPVATYCAMRGISKWVQRIIDTAQEPVPAGDDEEKKKPALIPVEVMIMQVWAFARPQESYFRMRNGEADYITHAFKWFDQHFTGDDRWVRLGRCYRFVLEQTGILEAVNPQNPEPTNAGTTPEILTTDSPAAPETVSSAPADPA